MQTIESPEQIELPSAQRPWIRLVVVLTVVTAAVDMAAMLIQGSIIPPVLVGAVLSLACLVLIRWKPKAGLITLIVLSVLLVASGAPFAVMPLGHPESPIGFVHSGVHLFGRVLVIVAASGALLSLSRSAARAVAATAAVAGVAMVMGATVATALSSTDTAQPGDVAVGVESFSFPAEMRAPADATLFVDNRDSLMHRFVVPGTAVAVDLAERSGQRVPLTGLAAGRYGVVCGLPGHESMTGVLVVE